MAYWTSKEASDIILFLSTKSTYPFQYSIVNTPLCKLNLSKSIVAAML